MGDLPLRTPTYHRLGGPLPRQLPNRTHAHLILPKISLKKDAPYQLYAGLIHVSMGYPPVSGRLHTRYSPVRRSPAEYCYSPMPLDLHVLSLSLAFILSQDQTLHSRKFFKEKLFDSVYQKYTSSVKFVLSLSHYSFIIFSNDRIALAVCFLSPFNILKNSSFFSLNPAPFQERKRMQR